MFGPIMQFCVGEYHVKMAPLCKEDMPQFVEDGGMQSHEVMKFMGARRFPTLEDEYEWYENTRSNKSSVVWGIYVMQEESWLLLGCTSLNILEGKPYEGAVSGFVIFRKEWWGKGIASHCHRARTLYAFDYLNLVVIRSAVMVANTGSYKALTKTGYVPVATERNTSFISGQWFHQCNLEMINPSREGWRAWWHGERPSRAFHQARNLTLEALEWAREHVELQ